MNRTDTLIDLVWDTCPELVEIGCSAEGIEDSFVYPPGMGSEHDRAIVANEIRNVVRSLDCGCPGAPVGGCDECRDAAGELERMTRECRP